jgi:Skp family chaperone for outer membrane proteins
MNGKATTLIVALAIIVAGWFTLASGQAQTPAPAGILPIGVVDLVKIFNDFELTKALNATLEREKRRLTEEQQKREEKLTVERDTLQGFAPDSAEYRKRSGELKTLVINYQAWLTGERESLKDAHRRWIERTYADITKAVEQVAKSKGLQLVLTREELETNVDDVTVLQKQILNRKVLYYEASMDISDSVLAAANDAFAKAGGAGAIKFGG